MAREKGGKPQEDHLLDLGDVVPRYAAKNIQLLIRIRIVCTVHTRKTCKIKI